DQSVIYLNSSGNPSPLTADQLAAFENAFHLNGSLHQWDYTIADTDLNFLGAGESVTVTTSIVITDPGGLTATRDIVVTINGVNDQSPRSITPRCRKALQ